MLDYISDNAAAFTFFATLVLVVVTAVYVVLTGRLARAQQDATRLQSEPVLVPSMTKVEGGWGLMLRNVSQALATNVKVAPEGLSIVGTDEAAALAPGDEVVFEFDTPRGSAERFLAKLTPEEADDLRSEEPLRDDRWGNFEILYSDAYDTVLIRTRIAAMQYREPLQDLLQDEWFLHMEVARERHRTKKLRRAADRRTPREFRSGNAQRTSADLWLALDEKRNGLPSVIE